MSTLGPDEEFQLFDKKNKWGEVFMKIRLQSSDYGHSAKDYKLPDFKARNRYRDVYPYDHSRVKLQRSGLDYINANFVDAPQANRSYILTQGPLADTCGHFWLMVWEQRTRAVLMLNKIIEKGALKCHRYYPLGAANGDEDDLTFVDVGLKVTFVKEDDWDYFVIRTYKLYDFKTKTEREVLQFHYTSWPDFDVPTSPGTFLLFLECVRSSDALSKRHGPAVIHCSAGIGRSGTFCLVDTSLVLIEKERSLRNIRVLSLLLEMRHYRMGLIQTPDQLRFSYQAILEGAERILDSAPNLSMGAHLGTPAKATAATSTAGATANKSNSNGVVMKSELSSSSDSDGIPDEAPPPPPRPQPTRARPRTANAARGRTPPNPHYLLDNGSETISGSPSSDQTTVEKEEEVEKEPYSVDERDQFLNRGVEVRRRKREERQKNTKEQIARMLDKQKQTERFKRRRLNLKPYLVSTIPILLLIGGALIYYRYYNT